MDKPHENFLDREREGLRRLNAFSPPDGYMGPTNGTTESLKSDLAHNNRELLNIAVEIG